MNKNNNLRTKHSWSFGLAYYFTLAKIQSGLNLENMALFQLLF